ncbi:MAG: hypothetical protein HY999_01005 [Nitrospinae bacterium]|nr:hypothetical protein [Nitrospinota bacterium]
MIENIEEVRDVVTEFLKRTLKVEDVKVIKARKVEDGWETEVEAYEESSFIKSLGLPTRVQDKNIYAVKLNSNIVESYERKESSKTTK